MISSLDWRSFCVFCVRHDRLAVVVSLKRAVLHLLSLFMIERA